MKTNGRILVLWLLLTTSGVWAGPANYAPNNDTFADEINPDVANGSLDTMYVRNVLLSPWGMEAMIKFDLSSIPAGVHITSARLYLHYFYYTDDHPAGQTIAAHRNKNAWQEATLTWNHRPACSELPSATAVVPNGFGWMNWDVTGDVQEFIRKKDNDGWTLRLASEDYNNAMIYFHARECRNAAYRPYLEITLSVYGSPFSMLLPIY